MRFVRIVCAIVFLSIFNITLFSYANTVAISKLKQAILKQQGLNAKQNLGTFGIFIDKVLAIADRKVNLEVYKDRKVKINKEEVQFKRPLIGFSLLRDKNDSIKSICYYNTLLAPFELRGVDMFFDEVGCTVVEVKLHTLSGKINKNITLRFKKGEIVPINKIPDCFYWGEVQGAELISEFDLLEKKIIKQHYVDPSSKNLGTLGKVIKSLFALINTPRVEDICIMRKQRIKNIPLQEFRADCFFIGLNVSITVIYNSKSEIMAVHRIRRYGNQLEYKVITFNPQGIWYLGQQYDVDNHRLKRNISYLIPYTKTEPETVR